MSIEFLREVSDEHNLLPISKYLLCSKNGVAASGRQINEKRVVTDRIDQRVGLPG